MKVPFVNLGLQHRLIKDELLDIVSGLLDSGQFILGDDLATFEKSFAYLCGTKYALGVANGTDALFLSMIAMGIQQGDEVITAPNSFLASASSIHLAGATPVFADVKEDFLLDPDKVRKAITPRTRAIMPVHLTGRPADMDAMIEIAREYNLAVVEDCAQAVCAEYKGRPVGSFGEVGCFSLHPLKNLSVCGDGGVITTSNEALYHKLLKARNHGLKNRDECEFWSFNSRLDNLQAALLNVKLKKLPEWTARRREIASRYVERLSDTNLVIPVDKPSEKAVYHTFIIQCERRDELKNFLAEHEIDSKIHYPLPIHLQEAAKYLGYRKGDFPVTEKQSKTILSLPVFPELTNEQIDYVCDTINEFLIPYSTQNLE
ncbi:MAG: DegT/DnrJ/EryC1/StrS family aminotransferase [Bacteroidetes bacterium]|nr:DegT/DnrJ/EryC1/StrS family aminotransferase [Bacteroidota bacterium]